MIEPPPTVVKTFSQRWFDWFSSLYNYVKGLESSVVDVTKVPYNAKGDGVTDDTAAIQAAIDFVAAKSLVGTVLLSASDSYKITSPLTIESPIFIGCEGGKAYILNATTNDDAFLFAPTSPTGNSTTPGNGGGLFNVIVYRNTDCTAGSAVHLKRWNSAKFDGCGFQEHHINARLNGATNTTFTNCNFNLLGTIYTAKSGGSSVKLEPLQKDDLSYVTNYNTILNNPRFSDSNDRLDAAIELNSCDNFNINGGYSGYHKIGISLKPTNNQLVVSVRCANFYIDGVSTVSPTTVGIQVNQNSTTSNAIGDFVFVGGDIAQCVNALLCLAGAATLTQFSFAASSFRNIQEDVTIFRGGSTRVDFSDCLFRNWGVSVSSSRAIKLNDAKTVSVVGCDFQAGSGTSLIGVSVESTATCDDVLITGSRFESVTTPYSESGSVTNRIINTNNSSTKALPSQHYEHIRSVGVTSPHTPNLSLSAFSKLNGLNVNMTIAAPTNMLEGDVLTLYFIQDATGGRTVTFNAVFKTTYTDTGNTASTRCLLKFVYDGTNWMEIANSGWV